MSSTYIYNLFSINTIASANTELQDVLTVVKSQMISMAQNQLEEDIQQLANLAVAVGPRLSTALSQSFAKIVSYGEEAAITSLNNANIVNELTEPFYVHYRKVNNIRRIIQHYDHKSIDVAVRVICSILPSNDPKLITDSLHIICNYPKRKQSAAQQSAIHTLLDFFGPTVLKVKDRRCYTPVWYAEKHNITL